MEAAITRCPFCQMQAIDLKFERADKYHHERHWWKCSSCSHVWAEITGPVLVGDGTEAILEALLPETLFGESRLGPY